MLTFLFWNMGGKGRADLTAKQVQERAARLQDVVARLAREHDVDVLMLAECPGPREALLDKLNEGQPSADKTGFSEPDAKSQCARILILPRFPPQQFRLRGEAPFYSCREIVRPGKKTLLLFVVHLASKLFRSSTSQNMALPGFAGDIRLQEIHAGHERTVVVGDFNMNPFETGMVAAEGLNAVMTRQLAAKRTRRVDAKDYPFLYNPMWGHFGDATIEVSPPGTPEHEPSGTCFFPARESRWYYWNMFDQVLLRPALLSSFRHRDLRILHSEGTNSLLREKGLPNGRAYSDHLPILFRLDI